MRPKQLTTAGLPANLPCAPLPCSPQSRETNRLTNPPHTTPNGAPQPCCVALQEELGTQHTHVVQGMCQQGHKQVAVSCEQRHTEDASQQGLCREGICGVGAGKQEPCHRHLQEQQQWAAAVVSVSSDSHHCRAWKRGFAVKVETAWSSVQISSAFYMLSLAVGPTVTAAASTHRQQWANVRRQVGQHKPSEVKLLQHT